MWSRMWIPDYFFVSRNTAEEGILGDLSAFLTQSPADFHDTRRIDWCCNCSTTANTLQSSALVLMLFSSRVQSGHALLTQFRSMCSWTLPCTFVLHLSHGFQCSPTLNCQPYEGRLPLTSWWRKSSNMTVGQSSLISLPHHCYDWHPGSRCG